MVELKQVYRVLPAFIGQDATKGRLQNGTVVYIHPKRRYAVLEFDGILGRPREGFHLDELTARNLILQKKGTAV